MQKTDRSWRLWLFLGLLLVGLGVQWWAAVQWAGNFDSDEAIYGLMAKHLLAGGPAPVYMYGNSYLGGGEAWLAAVILDSPLATMISSPVLALRLGNVLLFGLFMLAHTWLVFKLWGGDVALLSTLFVALPGALVLWWTYRPIGAFGLLLVCGTAALLLGQLRLQSDLGHYGRLVILGFVLGVGFWSHQLIVIYAAVLFLIWLLQTPEWRVLYMRVPAAVWSLTTVVLVGLSTAAFFTAACQPRPFYTQLSSVSQILLLTMIGWTAIGFGWVTQRSQQLLWQTILLGAGFLLGNFPQWNGLLTGEGFSAGLTPSCPSGLVGRGQLLLGQLLPHLWGASWGLTGSWWPILLAAVALPLMVAAVAYFLWYWRYIWGAIFTLRPLAADDLKIVLPVLLFGLPLLLALLGSNTVDVLSTRYLLPTWQASTILVAWVLLRVVQRRPWWGLGLGAILILHLLVGYGALNSYWAAKRIYTPAAVAELQTFLRQEGLRGGYADYWHTYTLNFLVDESVVLTPLTGLDRYPAYTAQVSEFAPQVYLLPAHFIRTDTADLPTLQEALGRGTLQAGPTFPAIAIQLTRPGLTVLSRQQVAEWDVWVVQPPSP